MTKPFSISLKQGERIFINGAVVRVDRKVALEFLNDVTFLLEAHVMQPGQTTTPLKQLYFIVQTMLMDPSNTAGAMQLFDASHASICNVLAGSELGAALGEVRRFVDAGRHFDALKTLRGCFAREEEILRGGGNSIRIRENLIGAVG
jgi:flagellar biosynthesis repressor protein FlbT